MVAVLTGEPLRFPMVEYFVSRPISLPTNHRIFSYESPLSATGSFDSINYHKNPSAIIACLKVMWNLTQDFESRHEARFRVNHSSEPPILFVEEPRHSFKTPLLTLPLLSSCHDLSHDHVLETLQGADSIYSCSLTDLNIDFPSALNHEGAFGKCTEDDFWVRYPGVLLWIMLVGTAAARGKEEAAFWMFYLARTGSFSSAENFLMEGTTIRRFLGIQRLMREDRSSL
ncbi:hypothetical protein LOCC1_G002223 [Lachnellula occidentalis]|uniref:Uncharacterized protein n=1 Tax=Lachnellula occidentalis TaxID=215460 RepID=A0A8H8S848_9HELO|nr:hypothetical protein LOCC1_G002223 [Lachnellula occidentalis]